MWGADVLATCTAVAAGCMDHAQTGSLQEAACRCMRRSWRHVRPTGALQPAKTQEHIRTARCRCWVSQRGCRACGLGRTAAVAMGAVWVGGSFAAAAWRALCSSAHLTALLHLRTAPCAHVGQQTCRVRPADRRPACGGAMTAPADLQPACRGALVQMQRHGWGALHGRWGVWHSGRC